MTSGNRLLLLLLFFRRVQAAAAFTKICPLNSAPIPLEYDETTGTFSLIDSSSSSGNNENEVGNASNEEVRRQLKRAVRVASNDYKQYLRARREKVQRAFMARSCPCAGDGVQEVYCLVEGIQGSVHDTCGVTHSALTLFAEPTSFSSANTKVECFKLESHTVFIRNAWPVVVFWYLALTVFLVATENGKNVRQYVISKLCPRCRINERRLDRIMQREIEYRNRIISATTRFARGRYLQRTRGMRVPNDGQTTTGEEAMGRWIAQAESLGILHPLQPIEYVLQTRKFHSKQELKNGETKESDANIHPSTPTKRTKLDSVSTPETVSSHDDDVDVDVEENSEPEITSCQNAEVDNERVEDEHDEECIDCTICLAPINEGQRVGILHCNHLFHAECLQEWIQRRNVCPLCQAREIATPRFVEAGGNESSSEDVVDGSQSQSPPAPNSPQRSSQRLQLQSLSANERRRRNIDAFFIQSP